LLDKNLVIDDSDSYYTVMFVHYKDKNKFNVDYELSYSLKKYLERLDHDDNLSKYREYDDRSMQMLECVERIRYSLVESVGFIFLILQN
jgi:hypothetical protein